MKVTTHVGTCYNCGKATNLTILNKQLSATNVLTLNDYNQFKALSVNKCTNCNLVGEDISCYSNQKVIDIVNSQKYLNILKNDYDNNFAVYHPSAKSLQLNYFDAYAYLCEVLNDYKKECICLFNCAQLKNILIGKYAELFYTSPDKNEIYKSFTQQLSQSRKNDLKKVVEIATQIDDGYFKTLLSESLILLNQTSQAKQILQKLCLDQNLNDYFKNLIKSVEDTLW